MKIGYVKFLLICFCFFLLNKLNAQIKLYSDTTNESLKLKTAKNFYKQELGENEFIYTGTEYFGYESNITGTAFLGSEEMKPSDIYYDGNLYENILMLYDLVRQEIVINRFNKIYKIKLLNEKLKWFTFNGRHFENIEDNKDDASSQSIYEVLNNGIAMALIKHSKRIVQGLKPEDPPRFSEDDTYFIRSNNRSYPIKSINNVLNALKDKKDVVRDFIKTNNFDFKKNIEKELEITATYYSTLVK